MSVICVFILSGIWLGNEYLIIHTNDLILRFFTIFFVIRTLRYWWINKKINNQ